MNENEMKIENNAEATALADINEENPPAAETESGMELSDSAEVRTDDAEKASAGEAAEEANAGSTGQVTREEYAHEKPDDYVDAAEMKPFIPEEVKPARFISPAMAWSCGTGMTDIFSSDSAKAGSDEKDDGADSGDDELSDDGPTIVDDEGGDGETDGFCDDGYDGEKATDENVGSSEPSVGMAPLSEEETRAVVTNPMFALFARGKSQTFDEICRDFMKMTAGTRNAGSRRMVTPSGSSAVNRDVALSDKQRKLAREYGMSYREYYELINGIPSKSYK
ncbi:MAG TPA: hypothetical protein DD628_01490 [Clostridiales bacterium]|nr:hypothetical protein [Candidatus Apopatosoma intestinale]